MKNKYEVRGEVTAIFLNSPKYGDMETIISTSKLEKAKTFENTWYVKYEKKLNSFYVIGSYKVCYRKRSVASLHRWLTDPPEGMLVDHFNHNALDNTDKNLRLATVSQNNQNKKGARSDSFSGIRGVHWSERNKNWSVNMRFEGSNYFFGVFDNLDDAERVAIEKRVEHMPFYVKATS